MDENHNDEKAVKEKITAAVDAAFKNRLNIRYHCHLNQFMVDYDIIRVLRNDMGYSAWAELTDVECGICFRNFLTGKMPCLTGTLKRRVSTITKWKLLMSGNFSDYEKNPVPKITKCKS